MASSRSNSVSSYSVSITSSIREFSTIDSFDRVCIIGEVTCDVLEAVKFYGMRLVLSETGEEYIEDERTLLVFTSFETEGFGYMSGLNLQGRIIGAPAFVDSAERGLEVEIGARPLLSLTMKNVVVCFTGIRDRCLAAELMHKIRRMGGSVRREPSRTTTHIIATTTVGTKYEYATTFQVPVMSPEWVFQCWKRRYLPGIHATDEELMAYRQKPFIECRAAFLGFSLEDEVTAMRTFLDNGGLLVNPLDPDCSHLVVDDQTHYSIQMEEISPDCIVVRAAWFWSCVQQVIRVPEEEYILPEWKERAKSEARKRQLSADCGCSREDKENSNCQGDAFNSGRLCFSVLGEEFSESGATPAKLKKLNVSISGIKTLESLSPEVANLEQSVSSWLCQTEPQTVPEVKCSEAHDNNEPKSEGLFANNKRACSFLELLETEDNYVKILDTILGIRNEAVNCDQSGGALLTETEAKVIFCNITAIHEAHRTILEELKSIKDNWDQSPSIGDVFIKICPDLLRSYVPYVSSFEEAKDMVKECGEKKPRFHAFLRICKGRAECGRQGLTDLMIRPIQRLGSTVLLLREIKKHTPPDNPDFIKVQSALESLSEVLALINEDKRKTEMLCAVFDVFNLIEYCPADIIASHRSLVLQMEAVQLSEGRPSQVGDFIMLFVFTDVLLLAKKKTKVVAMTKKPTEELSEKILKLAHGKPYKFLEVIPLSCVRRLINVTDNANVNNTFTLVTRAQDELRENHCSLRLVDGIGDKEVLLENFCRALASHTCTTDPNAFLLTMTAEQCGLTSSEVEPTAMNKASRMMMRTQCIVGSIFSGKPGGSVKANRLRTNPSFIANSLIPDLKATRSPSCSNLSEEAAYQDNCRELKTSSLTANIVKKL